MNKLRKALILLLCVSLCSLSLIGCGANKEEAVDYTDCDYTIETLLAICQSGAADQLEQCEAVREEYLDMVLLLQYGLPCEGSEYKGILSSWISAEEEMGAFLECSEFTYSTQNGEILATAEAQYEKRTASMVFTFAEDHDVKALSIGAHYSFSEILSKAGLNTILGMGVVFSVLIFLAVLIWAMGKILGGRSSKPQAAPAAVTSVPETAIEQEPEVEEDQTALVAVITAAICASTGQSSDGFVVRSIRRRSGNKWKQA